MEDGRALQDVRVLDLTTLVPGPLATMLLADLGADVIRVDAPDREDLLRWLPPHADDGQGALWLALQRNKRSVCLDLKHADGRAALLRLVASADLVVEQFRPGVLARLGLDYPALAAVNPRIILCSISSYGQTGPDASRAGHDLNFLARAGVLARLDRGGGAPPPLPVLIGDIAGGTWPAVAGMLAALWQRQRTGRGQHVDIAMADGALWLDILGVGHALASGAAADAGGHVLDGGSFYGSYRCADGRLLAVAALEPKFFGQLLQALGLGDRDDLAAGYLDPGPAGAALQAAIAEAIATEPLAVWQAVFAALDCCVEPVLDGAAALAQAQVAARGMVVEVPLADGAGRVAQVGCPLQLSASPPRYAHAGRAPGADTAAVLAEAGLDAATIAALITSGAAR